MGDEEEEPKYKLFFKDQEEPRENGSRNFTGRGKAFYTNKDTYEGEYVEGVRQGKMGEYTWHSKSGDSYKGQWEGDKKHGFGKLVYRNNKNPDDEEDAGDDGEPAMPRGGTYVGFYARGLRGCEESQAPDEASSDGTFTYANGDIYVGQWKVGKKHGRGTYTYAKDGTKLVGDWESGKITVGKWVFPNGTFYSGKFRYNKPYGQGVWVFPDGNQLTGEYTQKEQSNGDDDPPPDDEENAEPKKDPKVWCNFKYGDSVAVHGGVMAQTNLYDE
mmetsp:Transcript_22019/g.62596  ORF Transcript_22019/g.62596 Transcript_22019/m.62596 type:complete len:272 (-) Transcript_22019:48-863(-)